MRELIAARRPSVWAALLVGALATAALVLVDALVRDAAHVRGDDRIYERMAAHPFATHTFPFAYRIAVPWLVHVSPFSHTASFSLIAWLCSGAAAGALFVLLARFEAGPALRLGLSLGFALCPGLLIVSIRQGRNPDAAALLVLMLGTLFVVDRRPRALAVTLLIGALVRDSALFVIPFAYAVWARSLVDRDALRRLAAVAAPALVAYVVLRLAIPTVGRTLVPGYGEPFLRGRADVIRSGFDAWRTELRRVALAFGPLWLAAAFGLPRSRTARAGLVLLALCLFSATYALDWGRVIFFAAPAVYIAAVSGVRGRRRAAALAVVTLLAMDAGYAVYMDRHGTLHGIDRSGPPRYPVR